MRTKIALQNTWQFEQPGHKVQTVTLPHTWNNVDGQDGGNDYWRGICTYRTTFPMPDFDKSSQEVWIQFDGVNSSAKVRLNGDYVCTHDGGYSTFRADITNLLQSKNTLTVEVDNSVNDRVYPQKADFTFYGGIYRDVTLIIVNKSHFELGFMGGLGIKVTPVVNSDGSSTVTVETWHKVENATIEIILTDAEGILVKKGIGAKGEFDITSPHLWDGINNPYMYTATAKMIVGNEVTDTISSRFGIRSFSVDSKKGFMLNNRPYRLHGVSRHQDRKGIGNAITRKMHEEDMALIKEMGCNTVRLAHYQHDQYFYDLCNENGMVVWAEIPYISEHMPNGRENTINQMKELIIQNYNHPSIVCWGVSNEITISTKDKEDMMENHRILNDLCHEMDKTRFTTLACFAMCGPFNPVAHITDVVSWNLYLGWYVPGLFLNDLWVGFFHKVELCQYLGHKKLNFFLPA